MHEKRDLYSQGISVYGNNKENFYYARWIVVMSENL